MRSPHTIGDELPLPATRTFHKTFCVADHVSGYPVPGARPWPDGPRHRGQYRAASPSSATIRMAAVACPINRGAGDNIATPAAITRRRIERVIALTVFSYRSHRETPGCE